MPVPGCVCITEQMDIYAVSVEKTGEIDPDEIVGDENQSGGDMVFNAAV